jgi:hypothetical protein
MRDNMGAIYRLPDGALLSHNQRLAPLCCLFDSCDLVYAINDRILPNAMQTARIWPEREPIEADAP